MNKESRVAFVTGAARGIGRRIALTLAERGYTVAANDLQEPREALEELEMLGSQALAVPGDVSDEVLVWKMVEKGMSFRDAYREIGTHPENVPFLDPSETLRNRTSIGTPGNLRLELAGRNLSDLIARIREHREHNDAAMSGLAGGPVEIADL